MNKSPQPNTRKRRPTETTPNEASTPIGSPAGHLRKKSTGLRSGQKLRQSELSLFEKKMATFRARDFEKINRELQETLTFLRPELASSVADVEGNPYHEKLSQVENALGFYRFQVNEINRRYGGEAVGELATFGSNDNDILGYQNYGGFTFGPRIVSALQRKKFRQVEAGGMHTLALTKEGIPYAFGVNDKYALGIEANTEVGFNGGPVSGFVTRDGINEDGQITQIAAGESFSLFLSFDGNVYSCGMYRDDDAEEFKIPSSEDDSVLGVNQSPQHIWQMPGKAILIYSGANFAAAILEDRTMVTWGFGNCGELGRSSGMATADAAGKYNLMAKAMYINKTKQPKNHKCIEEDIVRECFLTPKPPRFNWGEQKKTILNIACGEYHMLVVAQEPEGTETHVYSTGNGTDGQLGHGDCENRFHLTLIKKFEGMNIAQVACGQRFSFALCMQGKRLYSFGAGVYGQLGNGKPVDQACTIPSIVPFPVEKPELIAKISAGQNTGFALTPDHDLYSWGYQGLAGHKDAEDNDTLRPRKLDVTEALKKYTKVFDITGGSGHAAMIVQRFDEPKRRQDDRK